MTKEEIIKETIEYYSVPGRRSVLISAGQESCCYMSPSGQMCAVGRCMKDDDRVSISKMNNGLSAEDLFETYGNQILKDDYQGHNVDFWTELQALHDDKKNWNTDSTLSSDGAKEVTIIARRFHLDITKILTREHSK